MAKIALVLSGGGARGYAHIGVIDELLARGHEITSITGTSMGAMIGGLYALGGLKSYKEWVLTLTPKKILAMQDFTMSINHLVKGERIINKLFDFCEDKPIEQLSIPFRSISSDLNTMKEIVFDKGSTFTAIRASISIPGYYSPLKTQHYTLVDGGITNPLPINRIPEKVHDYVVAVNLYGPDDEVTLRGAHLMKKADMEGWKKYLITKAFQHNNDFYSISVRSFQTLLKRYTLQTLKNYPPDVIISMPINRFGAFDFERAHRIITYGREKAKKAFDQHQL